MENSSKLVISFLPGSSGRFLANIFNYLLVSSVELGDNSFELITGSAHNDVVIGASSWMLPLRQIEWDSYLQKFKNDFVYFQFLRSPLFHQTINSNIQVINHLNWCSCSPERLLSIPNLFKDTNIGPVSKTHITNSEVLRLIYQAMNIDPLTIRITIDDTDDLIAIRTMGFIKNINAGRHPDPKVLSQHIHFFISTIVHENDVINVNSISSPIKNEICLPFNKIRIKDSDFLFEFIQTVCRRLNVIISAEQLLTVRNYIERYFAIQLI